MEHKVLVLGDSGINAKVRQSEWEEIVRKVVEGMRRGAPAEALVEAVRLCGDLLQKHGLARRPDDTDELPDDMRMG
jgi:putative membrane protein